MIRRAIPFNAEDEKVLDSLKQELRPAHGEVKVTAIVRMAIRSFLGQMARARMRRAATPERTVELDQ